MFPSCCFIISDGEESIHLSWMVMLVAVWETDMPQDTVCSCTTASSHEVQLFFYRSQGLCGQSSPAEPAATQSTSQELLSPQWSRPALHVSTLVKLHNNQRTYITSHLAVRKPRLIIIVRPSGQILATTYALLVGYTEVVLVSILTII